MPDTRLSPLAGHPATEGPLVDLAALVRAYSAERPDPATPAERVKFGTSGHRGSSLTRTFNEAHILAISQAICEHRRSAGIDGPLFLGRDTHALSQPAFETAMEVLAAHDIDVMIADGSDYTPTPVISHAILTHNRDVSRRSGAAAKADGIVITPSHNPPEDGGFKYNPPSGGPAPTDVTSAIEKRANALLEAQLNEVKRVSLARALGAATTHRHDYISSYVDDLGAVLDLDVVANSGLRFGVDPLGGAGVDYWPRIADRYRLNLTVVDSTVDMTFKFMTRDWDGRIRMDPSSEYAMRRLLGLRDRFDLAFACDTDHDRHGIVTRGSGLLPPNHYLSACIHFLFGHRPQWPPHAGVGKTVVSSTMIDRVAKDAGRTLFETPVGFKFFVDGLRDGLLGFAGEESAGASLVRLDGTPWSTDKDGIALGLLAAEITARAGRDPGVIYTDLVRHHGPFMYERTDARCTPEQAKAIAALNRDRLGTSTLVGEPIEEVLTNAPGNGASIGGIKIVAKSGWCAIRPSGTEPAYKIYAESFRDATHLRAIQDEAAQLVDRALG